MYPLHEAEGEVKDGSGMTQVGPEWQRCRIKKLGREEDHISTHACSGQGFPTGFISGLFNNLVLWEKRQGRWSWFLQKVLP